MENKGIKMIIHASAFFAPIIIPIIFWLLSRQSGVRALALQALFFHIFIGLAVSISYYFSFLLIGLPFLIVFGLIGIYYPFKGFLCALKGKRFEYPVVGLFFR
ncbi:DUF4870 domain-containing protein [Paenibacillus xerothermodurans]|uniref:DUF4870 domain-containing protein n=1 Tax=Paenibacillus xerothermodurans TaxID=1977292 RepID=A0A2W1NXI9_PAEXE|nr:DUF4870 domain-containing protein [Paenibacillus xerothermodurans]PZE20332.1 DUF4870 domain-containing protein [Paenibacillus xerothermodurans]